MLKAGLMISFLIFWICIMSKFMHKVTLHYYFLNLTISNSHKVRLHCTHHPAERGTTVHYYAPWKWKSSGLRSTFRRTGCLHLCRYLSARLHGNTYQNSAHSPQWERHISYIMALDIQWALLYTTDLEDKSDAPPFKSGCPIPHVFTAAPYKKKPHCITKYDVISALSLVVWSMSFLTF